MLLFSKGFFHFVLAFCVGAEFFARREAFVHGLAGSSTSQHEATSTIDPKKPLTKKATGRAPLSQGLCMHVGLLYFAEWTKTHRGTLQGTNVIDEFFAGHGFSEVRCSTNNDGCKNLPKHKAIRRNKKIFANGFNMAQFGFASQYVHQYYAYHAVIIRSIETAGRHIRDNLCADIAKTYFHSTSATQKHPCTKIILAVVMAVALIAIPLAVAYGPALAASVGAWMGIGAAAEGGAAAGTTGAEALVAGVEAALEGGAEAGVEAGLDAGIEAGLESGIDSTIFATESGSMPGTSASAVTPYSYILEMQAEGQPQLSYLNDVYEISKSETEFSQVTV
ncbi:hypothetical protein EJ08DRAFT_477219 [Tothia fuscella]|uniref:Uncharacterized protein n=1 Tax=Tothia fuscella TaxID=1048955 RepID=A0A9P4NIQ2_9PEZI|nr:hypothetical protein EJ08DRAFT_477219 [Tothia fuscella]